MYSRKNCLREKASAGGEETGERRGREAGKIRAIYVVHGDRAMRENGAGALSVGLQGRARQAARQVAESAVYGTRAGSLQTVLRRARGAAYPVERGHDREDVC